MALPPTPRTENTTCWAGELSSHVLRSLLCHNCYPAPVNKDNLSFSWKVSQPNTKNLPNPYAKSGRVVLEIRHKYIISCTLLAWNNNKLDQHKENFQFPFWIDHKSQSQLPSHADQSQSNWVLCVSRTVVLWTVTVQDPTFNVTSAGRTEHLYIQGQILNFKCIASTRDNLFTILSAQRSRRDKLINPRNGQERNTHVLRKYWKYAAASDYRLPTASFSDLRLFYTILSFYPFPNSFQSPQRQTRYLGFLDITSFLWGGGWKIPVLDARRVSDLQLWLTLYFEHRLKLWVI